ncbi:DMT family transporter [Streptomyces sp. 11x1]|uniref:DMT family transporter n=1 Tax=Streptomyces sp. 11x1 TaxID=3038642 RepID=UPI00292D57D8|nr:DMT family transporter [Streptomyces sp. 11x1]WNZ08082.1 DMT family transporter [Streptomyces sp. 11x1]
MTVSVLAALAAGACFAVAGVLQQRSASTRPPEEALSWRLLSHLLRQPMWLSGIGLAIVAYGFQSLALAFGPLSLVQPLIVCELVFAIPLSARLHRVRLGMREWSGTVAVAAGLATALVTARPSGGDPATAHLGPWLLASGTVAAVVAGALVVCAYVAGVARASFMALAAGAVMGFQSVLLAATVARMPRGFVAVVSAWQTYVLVVASVGGLLLIQSAFREGPLAASVTVIDTTEPVVAVTVGATLFGETLHGGWPLTALTVTGVAATVVGIVCLDTSPAIAALHRRDTLRQESAAARGRGARSAPPGRSRRGFRP